MHDSTMSGSRRDPIFACNQPIFRVNLAPKTRDGERPPEGFAVGVYRGGVRGMIAAMSDKPTCQPGTEWRYPMRQLSLSISPTYSYGAELFHESPSQYRWIMIPAIAIAVMTFALVWTL